MLEKALISAVVHQREETVYRVHGALPAALFSALASSNVNVDTILQSSDEIVFSAPPEDRAEAARTLDGLGARWQAQDDLGKVSVIGAGMKSHPGVAARMFQTLAEHGINVRMIATSPIKVSCVIARDKVDEAVLALHDAFQVELELAQSGAAHA